MAEDREKPAHASQATFYEQAERCRRLSRATYDRSTAEMLDRMAESYDRGSEPEAEA